MPDLSGSLRPAFSDIGGPASNPVIPSRPKPALSNTPPGTPTPGSLRDTSIKSRSLDSSVIRDTLSGIFVGGSRISLLNRSGARPFGCRQVPALGVILRALVEALPATDLPIPGAEARLCRAGESTPRDTRTSIGLVGRLLSPRVASTLPRFRQMSFRTFRSLLPRPGSYLRKGNPIVVSDCRKQALVSCLSANSRHREASDSSAADLIRRLCSVGSLPRFRVMGVEKAFLPVRLAIAARRDATFH